MSFLWLASRPNAGPCFDSEGFMWYRKREEMSHIAKACGVEAEFKALNNYIHHDDIEEVQAFLEVTDECMEQLFEEKDSLPKR